MVVLGHGPFSFEDLDEYSGLVVLVGGKRFGLLGGDDAVPRDNIGHHAAHCFDALVFIGTNPL